MRAGTTSWITGCSCDPGRPAPPMCEVSGAGLPYGRLEVMADRCSHYDLKSRHNYATIRKRSE